MSRRGIVMLVALFAAFTAVTAVGLTIHRSNNRDSVLIGTLQFEYDNGGLFQFFWNTRGRDNAATLAVLQRSGDDRHAEVFRRAIVAFEAEKSMLESAWQKFDDGHDVGVYSSAVQRSAIPSLDAEWAALPSLIPQGS